MPLRAQALEAQPVPARQPSLRLRVANGRKESDRRGRPVAISHAPLAEKRRAPHHPREHTGDRGSASYIRPMIDRRVQILSEGAGKADIATVSGLRDRPFLVLLGEPGIGKTTVLEAEAGAEGTPVIKVRELINETVVPGPGSLYLDALDEYRVGATDLDKVHLLAKSIMATGATRWRLTCRSEDWQKGADIAAVERAAGGATITIAQILPLDLFEAIAVLDELGEANPEAFVDRAQAMGATGLLESPLSIRLLREAIGRGGAWPMTRFALFHQATVSLAHEENIVHRLDRSRASASDILEAAERACLFLLVTGSRYLWRSGALPPSGDTRAYLSADDLQIGRSLVDEMLDSALFRGEGEEFEPIHRTVAEFLGGRALARAVVGDANRAALPLGRARALINGPDGRAPTDLRGLYGWFAAHLAAIGQNGLARELAETDAVSVLVYGDAAAFDAETKRAILANLDRDDPYFRASEVGATAVGGLACEELAGDFAKALEHGDGTHRMMTVYEVLTAGNPVMSLRPLLRSIALDPARPEWQRTRAMSAWLNGQEDMTAARRELFDALAEEPLSAPRESMRAELLGGLPPDDVAVDDIVSVVRDFAAAPDDSTVMRLYGLQQSLVANPRPDLFDVPHGWLPDESTRRHSIDIEHLIDHALAAAIRSAPDLDGARLWLWLSHAREDRWSNLGDQSRPAVQEWLTARPGRDVELFEAVLATDDPTEGPWMIGTYYIMVAGSPGAAILDRLVEQARAAKSAERKRLLEIAVNIARRYDVGMRSYWGLHAFLEALPRGNKRLLKFLTIAEIEGWRRRDQKRARKHQRAATEGRESENRTLRRFIPEISQAKRTHPLDWAAQIYFHPRTKEAEGQARIERLAGAVDSDVLDAILSGWRLLATSDHPDHAPSKLGAFEATGQRYFSEHGAIAGLDRLRSEAVAFDTIALPLSLAIVVLRSGWIAHADSVQNELENWAWERLNADPAQGGAMLVELWEATLAAGASSSNLWQDAGDDRGGEAARQAILTMLERHPAMLPSVLRTLITAGARLVDRPTMADLAAAALASPAVQGKQRTIWAVVAFVTDPLRQGSQLNGHLDEDLHDLFGEHFHDGVINAFAPGTDVEQAMIAGTMFEMLAPLAEPYVDRRRGAVTKAHRLSDAANAALKRLGASSADAATDALVSLLSKIAAFPKWEASLRHEAAQQARARRDREFVPPSAAAVAGTLAGQAPVNAADLRAILVDELRRFGRELRTGVSSNWRDYWNTNSAGKATEPKIENIGRDITLGRLQERLAKYQVAVAAPEAGQREDTRVDMLIATGAGRTLPIEAKRHYHKDLWTAASVQLQGYAGTDKAEGLGILLVFWFGDVEAVPKRDDGESPNSAAELEALLVGDLRSDLAERTDIIVLDVSAPERASSVSVKPARKTAVKATESAGNADVDATPATVED